MIPTNATTAALFLLVALLVVSDSGTACEYQDKQTLLSFLRSLSTPLQSWNTTIQPDCCIWEGITCNPSNSVTHISLPNRGLTGKISPILSNLTNLSYLNLSRNFLSGSLPVELLSLSTSLKSLDFSFNKLSGVILGFENPVIRVFDISSNFLTGPLPIINATSLLLLNVTDNSLTGPIPNHLCTKSPLLITLAISYNEFSGKISRELENCTTLRDFHAGSNNLVGSLPDELFKLASLQNLFLSRNEIDGSLNGAMIGRLQNLVSLDLGTNFLIGSIPETIGQLKKLQYLDLSSNGFTGMLPLAIENCSNLRQLSLWENKLTGNLQFINFTKLSNLQHLDLNNNSFTGEIPESIYTCKNLNALRLSINKITGQISPNIENLRALSFLSLSSINLVNITGALENLSKCKNLTALIITRTFIGEAVPIEPTWENGFENIQILSMALSGLIGIIPSWISKLTKLKYLEISGNQFTGPIPDWIGSLSNLFYLDLSNNYLSGNIPQSITNLSTLTSVDKMKQLNLCRLELPLYLAAYNWGNHQYKTLIALRPTIDLGENQLNGTIPQEIGQLTMLHTLYLSNNNLLGTLPESMGNLTNLEDLVLSHNKLTGPIPASFTQLHFLSTFSVASNNLSGPVPIGGQLDTFSSSSYEGNSNLCGPVVMRICGNLSNIDNEAPRTSERFDRGTVIAVVLGYFFGVTTVLLQQFYCCNSVISVSRHHGGAKLFRDVWKERNRRIFQGATRPLDNLIYRVLPSQDIELWRQMRHTGATSEPASTHSSTLS